MVNGSLSQDVAFKARVLKEMRVIIIEVGDEKLEGGNF